MIIFFTKKNKTIIFIVLINGILLCLFLFPDVYRLKRENPGKTSFMKYREMEWIREKKNYKIEQKWVPLSRISPYLKRAVIIAEDAKFWDHQGFDYEAIQIALQKNIKAKKFKMGASTITQQLAKNLFLSPSKNPLRKIMEAVITWRIERTLTKARILEIYLNVAEWGDRGIFGIESASRFYFGKHASDLNALESAKLAAILPNPRRYNPHVKTGYIVWRTNCIYKIIVGQRLIPL